MKLDPKKTAMLTLDFQRGIFDLVKGSESAAVIPGAKAAEFGRKKQYKLFHVGLGFTEGHPEISETSSNLQIKVNNLFIKGSASGQFDHSIVKPNETIVYKHRIGAFSENELHLILRAHHIENLVFFGVSTSGIVLSTLRRAYDLDYKSIVLKDACFDADPEVHRILTEKIFAKQARVLSVDEFITEQGIE